MCVHVVQSRITKQEKQLSRSELVKSPFRAKKIKNNPWIVVIAVWKRQDWDKKNHKTKTSLKAQNP